MKKFLSTKAGSNTLAIFLTIVAYLFLALVVFSDTFGAPGSGAGMSIDWGRAGWSGIIAVNAGAIGFIVAHFVNKRCKAGQSGEEAEGESAENSGEK